jgi:hypothetical protein
MAWKVPAEMAIEFNLRKSQGCGLGQGSIPMINAPVAWDPMSFSSLNLISFAALFVNVTAQIFLGSMWWWSTMCATRHVSTRVFPKHREQYCVLSVW